MKVKIYDVSFIITNWNTKQLLIDCLKSIYDTVKDISFEVWVIDNGSSDDSIKAIEEMFPEVKLIKNEKNMGFAKANNLALMRMSGRYAVLLNTDTVVTDNAIKIMVNFMDKNHRIGICGGQLLNKDGSKQNSVASIPNLATELTNKSLLRRLYPEKYHGKEHCFNKPIEVSSVVGACMVVRKEAIDEVGFMDEDYFFFLEETDWCLRFTQKSWKVFHHPKVEIFHLQGQSAKRNLIKARIEYWKSRYIFFKKHRGQGAQIVLRVGLLIKLLFDFILTLLYNLTTLFTIKKGRGRLKLYSAVVMWHLAGCPDSWGLNQRCHK
ncbi:MAG: glycosyltransferase family 2 protein [Nitrospirae bacterium]|nr:glycosyltransferase family 2 protein [Nitrospirota bacterium]